jgi:hypothetical protein
MLFLISLFSLIFLVVLMVAWAGILLTVLMSVTMLLALWALLRMVE